MLGSLSEAEDAVEATYVRWYRMTGAEHAGGAMTDDDADDRGTSLAEVFVVLRALSALGCRFWLEGGWGVDALVGHQTRSHRDLDVDLDARCEKAAVAALAALGYTVETDWRPNRVELKAPARGRVDRHPLFIDDDGTGRQAEGGFHVFPTVLLRHWVAGRRPGPVPFQHRAASVPHRLPATRDRSPRSRSPGEAGPGRQ
jgi:lincosamide nucleotidyltransferase A/C/D/E